MSWPVQRGVIDVARLFQGTGKQGARAETLDVKSPRETVETLSRRMEGIPPPASSLPTSFWWMVVGERTRPVTSLSTPGAPCGSSCFALQLRSPSIREGLGSCWERLSGVLAPSC
jgi:hypothetical protein